MENIPAKTVSKFLESIEQESAVKIQKIWRGYKTRLELPPQLAEARSWRAAIKIQRQVPTSPFVQLSSLINSD